MTTKLKPLRAAVLAALVPAFMAGCNASAAAPSAVPGQAASAQSAPAIQHGRYAVPDFSQLAEQAGPAVVNISVTEKASPTSD